MKRWGLFILAGSILLLISVSCSQFVTPQTHPLSIDEAQSLVRDWIFTQNPDMNPSAEFPLAEVGNAEIWERLGAQVFQVNDGIYQYETYLIKGQEVAPLGTGYGGMGVMSLCVTDLDQNGAPELLYTYSWGSGIHRSQLGMYAADVLGTHTIDADLAYFNGDWTLEKCTDQAAFLMDGEVTIGQVVLETSDGTPLLKIRLEAGLPQAILDNVHGYDR